MKISIFGMGYVGCVSAACFADNGHSVVGVDINPLKVDMINKGQTPIIEKDINEIISDVVEKGSFSATSDTKKAISETDAAFICVGTPSEKNGSLNIKAIQKVSEEIGKALKELNKYFVVIKFIIFW